MPLINMAAYVSCTEVEGPGKRFTLWVQGCLKRCPGCCNPQMLDVIRAQVTKAEQVLELIDCARREHQIEGITFLGGEPFLQARGLSYIARRCREWGLSVMVFTGYTLRELRHSRLAHTDELLAEVDLLVEGPYLQEQPEQERRWVGSKNQQFHFLSNYYEPGIEYLEEGEGRNIEIRVGQDGEVQVNGWPLLT